MYQLKEYIKSFQREMSFPKPQRGDIFIETEKPKHTKLQRSDIESIRRLKIIRLKTLLIFNFESFNRIKYIAPSELWVFV
jgi:ABC-type histidine transport system ATPase subunit